MVGVHVKVPTGRDEVLTLKIALGIALLEYIVNDCETSASMELTLKVIVCPGQAVIS